MHKLPRPLFVLHSDPFLRERLRAALPARGYELRFVADWDELLEGLRGAAASATAVVDPYTGIGSERRLSPDLAALLHRFPSATVVAAMAMQPGCLEQVRRLGEWGVVQILDLDEGIGAVELVYRLEATRGRPLRDLVQHALPAGVSGSARAILAAASRVVIEGGQGKELARSLHVTLRTLSRWCRRAGLPPPRPLLAWMRILLAAELLDDPGRTVGDVAFACGYSADASLRNVLRAFLGRSPTALREEGAFRVASAAFVEALGEARSRTAIYRRRRGDGEAAAPRRGARAG